MSPLLLLPPETGDLEGVPTRERPEVSWATVALLTIVIAVVDGFWVTSLHGAVGDVASGQDQFHRWLHGLHHDASIAGTVRAGGARIVTSSG